MCARPIVEFSGKQSRDGVCSDVCLEVPLGLVVVVGGAGRARHWAGMQTWQCTSQPPGYSGTNTAHPSLQGAGTAGALHSCHHLS